MNKPEQSAKSGYEWEGGWDDHERRERLGALSLPEKLAWLEEAQRMIRDIASKDDPPGR